jgi:hypothetical protein
MPTVNCSPLGPKPQIELSSGLPAVGYKVFFYVAGSVNTKQTTYTDSTGTVANANPLVLNSLGQPTTEVWFTAGQAYKVVLAPSTDTDPPTSPVWSIDNLRGINDTSVTLDQWVTFAGTPTFINGTQFQLDSDQSSTFHVGRRVNVFDGSGVTLGKFGRISVVDYNVTTPLKTTVTIVNDGAVLVTPLSTVSYGLLSATNPSIPTLAVTGGTLTQSTARLLGRTTAGTGAIEELTAGSGLTLAAGTLAVIAPPQIQPVSASVAANAITISTTALTLDFRDTTLTTGTPTTVSGTPSNLVIASTDSFGLVTAAGSQRLAILAINNAGTIELAALSLAGGVSIDETGVITTVTAATTSTQIKSASVRAGVAYRVIGLVDATFTTAVGWGSLALVQGAGGNAADAMQSLGYGQTWQSFATGARASGTTYYNNTGRPIMVSVYATGVSSGVAITVGGLVVATNLNGAATSGNYGACAIVPPGAAYSATYTPTFGAWHELR